MLDPIKEKPTFDDKKKGLWQNCDIGNKETGQTRCESGYVFKSDSGDYLTNYKLK